MLLALVKDSVVAETPINAPLVPIDPEVAPLASVNVGALILNVVPPFRIMLPVPEVPAVSVTLPANALKVVSWRMLPPALMFMLPVEELASVAN